MVLGGVGARFGRGSGVLLTLPVASMDSPGATLVFSGSCTVSTGGKRDHSLGASFFPGLTDGKGERGQSTW